MKTQILKFLLLTSLGYLAINLGTYLISVLAYLKWCGFSSNGDFPMLFVLPPQVCLNMLLRVHQEGPLSGSGLFTARCFVVESGFCCLAYVFGRTGYKLAAIPLLYLTAYPVVQMLAMSDGSSDTWIHVIEGICVFVGLSGALVFGYHSRFWMPEEVFKHSSAER